MDSPKLFLTFELSICGAADSEAVFPSAVRNTLENSLQENDLSSGTEDCLLPGALSSSL